MTTTEQLQARVPPEVLEVMGRLTAGGFRAVLVGGSVRDLLLGKHPKDFDVATSAPPAQVQRLFPRVIPTGIAHGTVTVIHRGRHVEVTTFRAEAEYVDGRRPSKVEFHEDVDADLSRRDFTINAMAWDPTLGLVDPFGGQADLEARVVRCVREPLDRFSEDGLRALRAVRFSTVLDFALDPATEAAIPPTLAVFRKVALERVQQELVKILLSPRAGVGLGLLARTGLLGCFLPEAAEARFAALGQVDADQALRLAVLLEAVADVRGVVARLKFPTAVADEAQALVRARPLPAPSASDGELRRYLAKVGPGRVGAVLQLTQALDGPPGALADRLHAQVAAKPPLTAKDLALDGRAIMDALQVGPSKLVGDATRYLVDRVLEEPGLNTPDALRAQLQAWKTTR